jgi:radical SAM superfamily enzyme YgiQ (UPF0313 family)
MRQRLKLITLPWELEVPTLSLASLAAVTPPQFDVAIVDVLRETLFFDEPTDLVGITASTPTITAAYALADAYRAKGVTVVLGGHHVTAMPDEALAHADAVVVGEGEVAWQRICEAFLVDRKRVQGLYRDASPDLATLPPPRTDLLRAERYGAFTYPIIASRGCPESCGFCFAKRVTAGYRTYPIATVLEQIRRRPKWVRSLYFVDDNLPADPDWARELFAALKKEGVPFGMQARHEFSRDTQALELAREAGCALISSGYESVNQASLDRQGKRALAGDYRDVIAEIFRVGIMPSGNWMFGFDQDTPDTFARTLDFLDTTDLLHCSFTSEIPFPGTAAWKKYKAEGRLLTEAYDDYVGKDHVVVKPLLMSPDELRDGIRWLARSYYSPRRAAKRALKAMANPRLHALGPSYLKAPAFFGLNAFQVWQWHYRMVPALQAFYQRLLKVYRYRYPGDLLKGTNFRAVPAPPPWKPPAGEGRFHASQAWKKHRAAPLMPHEGQVRAPS